MQSLVVLLKHLYAATSRRTRKFDSRELKTAERRRFVLESLEARVLLSADVLEAPALIAPPEPPAEEQIVQASSGNEDSNPAAIDQQNNNQTEQEEEDGGDFIDSQGYDEAYGEFDYDNFLNLENNGAMGGQGGAVDEAPTAADVLTNNNAGATTTAGFTQSETAVIAFGSTVLVAFNDSGSATGGTNKFTGFSRSTDGGSTFVDGGVLPTNGAGDAGDPVLARNDTTGRIYFATLQFATTPTNGIDVFHSDDDGLTWSAPAQGAPGKPTVGLQDKEWIAVDNFAGAGNGNVYLTERDFGPGNGIYFFRSTDNGTTFGPSGGTLIASAAAGNVQGAFVTVGPDHSVYVFWYAGTTSATPTSATIQMRKSIDQGLTFGAPVTVATFLTPDGSNGDLALTGIRQGTATASIFRSNKFPDAAVNPTNGNIYVTYNDNPAGTDRADIFVVQSTTGGATWGAPVKVNDDTTTTDQWQPTLAVTPGGDKLGIFYSSRQEDPTGNNLFKYYGRIANISGATMTFTPSFAISDTASLPEFGRDGVVNPVYMGDYNTAYATPGFFNVSWSDNRDDLIGGTGQKDPNVYFKAIDLGLTVRSTTPANGAVVSSIPLDYVVNFSDPIQNATVNATDFTVEGVAASSFVVNTATQVTFHFNSAPFTTQGVHTMAMAAGAILRSSDADGLAAFSGTFRYDALPLQVTSTVPPVGGVFILPGPFTYDVNFNEAINPASVQTWDLAIGGITGATVTGVTVLPGNTTARFTFSGISAQGPLQMIIMAGSITDTFGNPNTAFSASESVDLVTAPLPTPLTGKDPAGSLIYDPSLAGFISFAGDTDTYTLNVDPGQTITVKVTPTAPIPGSSTLQPSIQIIDPSGVTVGSSTAAAANQNALLQTVSATLGGTYQIVAGSAVGSLGSYTLQVILNAALENEGNIVGGNNNTATGTEQTINAVDSGMIASNGAHSTGSNGYLAGTIFGTEFRNYATFALSSATPSILGAELRLFNPSGGYNSPDTTETYTLFDVTASSSALDANRVVGDATGIAIYGDLASGTVYGSRVVSAADNNSTVAITLNADAVAALNTAIGSTISFGGAITTLAGTAQQEIFLGANGSLGTIQLVLQTVNGIIAENIDSSFITLSTPQDSASRGAVLGQTDTSNNYIATAVAPSFEDISSTGIVITPLTNQDNASVGISIPFAFPLYGVSNTLVFISSNGLLTFGSSNTSGANADLLSAPGQPSIAPFWDDLHTGGGVTGSNVYFQTTGSGANQHLTVQWNKVRFLSGGTDGDTITFEAQLFADGRIQFNYLDLVSGTAAGNNGASATVGIKSINGLGTVTSRLLLALNNGPNAFVGTGKSTLIALPDPTPDFYAFTLNTGEIATLAVTGLTAGNLALELRDSSDAVLATGLPSINLSSIISNFAPAVGGTYFARISGGSASSSVPYSLVVTKNAAFDTEGNNTAATAQNLDGNLGALGQVTATGTFLYGSTRGGQLFKINLSTGAGSLVGNLPIGANEIEFDNLTGRAFEQAPDGSFFGQEFNINTGAGIGGTINNGASFNGMEWVGSTLYATAITGPGTNSTLRTLNPYLGTSTIIGLTGFGPISGLAFDSTLGIMYGITGGPTGNLLRLNLTTGAVTLIGPTGFRAGSLEFGPDGLLYGGGTGPDEFKIFRINPATGASTLVGMTGIGTAGSADVTGLALAVTGSDDWYSITVPITANALRLQTSTPGDGPGEPVNTLDPKVEVFNPTGATLLASGVDGTDGRNESLVIRGLTPGGTYKVRVSAENGSLGEYFLTRNFDYSPVVTNLAAPPIDENDTATLTGAFTDLDATDTHTVIITWGPGEGSSTLTLAAGVLNFSSTHQYLDDAPTGSASDLYPIAVTVTDNRFGSDSGSVSLSVNNVAAAITTLTPGSSIDENGIYTLTGTFHDPGTLDTHTVVINWGGGTPTQASEGSTTLHNADLTYQGNGNWSFSSSHQYLDDNSTGTLSDVYSIGVSVIDDDSGTGSGSTNVTVNDVAPVVAPISGPADGVRGQALNFSGSFTDVGTLDTQEVRWDFGDGTVIDFHPTTEPNALSGPTHVYADSGVYTLTLTIRDDDGGLTSVNQVVTISAVAIQVDPCDSSRTALVVGGTTGDDTIVFTPQGNDGDIQVIINGVSQGVFHPTGLIIAYGQSGDDDIQVAGSINSRAWLYGDAGNDRIKGSAGNSILLGGDGDDQLNGGGGRSILIGGRGEDRLVGGSGDDILIGGFTSFDSNPAFLCSMMDGWDAVPDTYSIRVARIRAWLLLNSNTIVDDGEVDRLTGSSGLDWFFAGVGDVVTDQKPSETAG